MTISPTLHQAHSYRVITPVYEGPLDLLLQLIERAELDITRLALAQITDQYLEHIRAIPDNAAEDVSAFLVIAARLLQIKSEALLPRPPLREAGEEDPGEALARQLILYKRFKELANLLALREAADLRTYPRQAPSQHNASIPDLAGITVQDLLLLAQQALLKIDTRQALGTIVAPPKITIREKISLIARMLKLHTSSTFEQLLTHRGRLEVVVTFLAVLELVKRQMILVRQEHLFGQIEIEAAQSWDENTPIELEFGE
jgi:segregation and condensation protein A